MDKMKDVETTLQQLKKRVIDFRNKRDWGKYNTIDNLLMSIVIELGELMEHFQWRTQAQSIKYLQEEKAYNEVRFELADVFVYLLTLSDDLQIDIAKAVDDKLKKQDKKYPVKKMLDWNKMTDKEKWEDYMKIKKQYRNQQK